MRTHIRKYIWGLCTLLLFAGGIALSTLPVSAASTPERYDLKNPDVLGQYFDANGTHLYIDAGTGSGKTVIYYMNGDTKVYLNKNGAEGEDLSKAIIYGGTHQSTYTGDTHITMSGGSVLSIFGGSDQGTVKGNVLVEISGGSATYVYGTASSPVEGNSKMVITGGTLGYVSPGSNTVSGRITGDASLIITGGNEPYIAGPNGTYPVNGTVSGIVARGVMQPTDGGVMMTSYYNHLIYREESGWTIKGTPQIPEGITLTIPEGDAFALAGSRTISNQGTIKNQGTMTVEGTISGGKLVNEGTLIVKYPLKNVTLENHGTVTNYAVYVDNISSISGLTVMKDNAVITPEYYIWNNRLYLFTGSGSIMAQVNDTWYYGTYDGNGEQALSAAVIPTTDVTGVPAKAYKNVPINLPVSAQPTNMSAYNQVTWECLTSNASLSGNVLTPTEESGTIRIRATVKNGLGYGTDFTKIYELVIQEGAAFDIGNGSIKITGNADGTALVKQILSSGANERTVGKGEWILITGETAENYVEITGGEINLQFSDLKRNSTAWAVDPTLEMNNTKVHLVLSGETSLQDKYGGCGFYLGEGSQLTISGEGLLTANTSNNSSFIDSDRTDGTALTINGGRFDIHSWNGYGFELKNGTVTINGGTLSLVQDGNAVLVYNGIINTNALIVNGGNIKSNTIVANSLSDKDSSELVYAEITLDGLSEDAAVTALTGGGSGYGLNGVKTMDKVLYVYAKDADQILSVTAGGKTYVGILSENGTKSYGSGNVKRYTGTFSEGSVTTLSGVNAEDAVYTGQHHKGYTGTVTNAAKAEADYTYTYIGRNGTSYHSAEAPVNAGDYMLTIQMQSKDKKTVGSLSLDFKITPQTMTGLSLALSQETYTYDGDEKTPEVTLRDQNGQTVSKDDHPYEVNYKDNVEAGTATVTVTSAGTGNYKFSVSKTFKIEKATPVVSNVHVTNAEVTNAMKSEDVKVDGTASVDGTFTIDIPSLVYGKQKYDWHFTPADTKNYNTVDGTLDVDVKDKTKPTGSITIKENVWKSFLNKITFHTFFKETADIIIDAKDDASGVDSIFYYLTDTPVLEKDIKDVAWIAYSSALQVENNAKYIVYAKITDGSGNIAYLSSDGVVFDSIDPVIDGVTDGEVYYVSQKVEISDENLAEILVNETSREETSFVLAGDQDISYIIQATDKAGNQTKKAITMKPIASITEPAKDLTAKNVTSDDKENLEELLKKLTEIDAADASESEKNALDEEKEKIEDLLEAIQEAQDALKAEEIKNAEKITPENVQIKDKDTLEKAQDALEKALEDHKGNYTKEEQENIKDRLEEIEDALSSIDRAEKAEEAIRNLPDPENTGRGDETAEAAVKKAQEIFDALTEHEKEMVDADLKQKLEDLNWKLFEAPSGSHHSKEESKDASKTGGAPHTGDDSKIVLWSMGLLVSVLLLLGVVAYRKKNR